MAHPTLTTAAVAASINRKPPSLSMDFPSGPHHTRRQSSAGSSSDDDDSPGPLSALDSSAALILVHDSDDSDISFEFSDDDEDEQQDTDDIMSPMFQVRNTAACPPLSPSLVFLYLLAPLLRLGALDLRNSQLPLRLGLPALLLSALASAFARQIWYMLARYLRKADMTDVLLNTFARGRGKERQRAVLRGLVRLGSGLISLLLSVTYLRLSLFTVQPLLPRNIHPILSYLALTSAIGLIVSYLSYARSLASKRVVYATSLSIITYTIWLGCTIYAHTHGVLKLHPGWLGAGPFWQGIATTAFAFCSSSTLPLYASLKSTSYPVSTRKTPRSRSFRILSITSIVIAVLLLLPSVLFSAIPNSPATSSPIPSLQVPPPTGNLPNLTTISRAIDAQPPFPDGTNAIVPILPPLTAIAPPPFPTPKIKFPPIQSTLDMLAALTLLLSIPSIMVTAPHIPLPGIRSARFNVSKVLSLAALIGLSLIPPQTFAKDGTKHHPVWYLASLGWVGKVLTAALLVMALAGTYFLPAFVHICVHWFKKPLAIVVPPRTPLVQTQTQGQGQSGSRQLGASPGTPRVHDELLLRKERALQRRQLKKRIVWDVGVWLLVGASGAGVVGTVGGFVGVW